MRNVVRKRSKRFVLSCIDDLAERGARGVVLGCTELPFAARQADSSIPLFDTAALHAQRALELAMAESWTPTAKIAKND